MFAIRSQDDKDGGEHFTVLMLSAFQSSRFYNIPLNDVYESRPFLNDTFPRFVIVSGFDILEWMFVFGAACHLSHRKHFNGVH